MAERILKADIEQFLKLRDRRRELERRAKALEKDAKKLEERLAAHVRKHGGKARTVVRSGFVLSLADKPGSVQWKTHFIEQAGHDAAEALIEAAETREVLTVEAAKK